jgi:hypothetical protein
MSHQLYGIGIMDETTIFFLRNKSEFDSKIIHLRGSSTLVKKVICSIWGLVA